MKIGIIGTGAIGGTIAKKMVAAGHHVKVSNSDQGDKLNARAVALGASPATIENVVKDVDVIILSVPTVAIPTLPKDLFKKVPDNVIVVDTSNYYPFRDADIEEIKNGKVESVWVSEQLGRPVIKAFNNLLAETLENGGKEPGAKDRIAMAVAGDHAEAKKVIVGLVNDAGFDAVDSGDLSESWKHQPGTPAYCTELNAEELEKALSDGIKEEAPFKRDKAIAGLSSLPTYPSHPDVVKFNRALFEKNPNLFKGNRF
ncbi:NADPH-dependent F420 reductase [Dyadobacter pollutisoli]|uniref:NAD(P)-binding domain-containing protein n=1 Tax=Dyadobacter pollutisoli TaxID=2910158 RepID=A0A9E8NE19_9BACT|nr:NAD(P)-binding domain-containing protein [Dyadobacter pollutisoli]WAC13588.1 NAD(P)-binding domain-containing protein [Dyadobacter pollutisoli]